VTTKTFEHDHITLRDRSILNIRSLRRGEHGAVRELCARLSPRTRRFRFFLPLPVVPDSLIRMLADVDDPRRLALIVELDPSAGGDVVALGNVAAADDDSAEIALVVADTWQRRGIGTALAERLLQEAESRGWTRFVAEVLSENPAARPLLHRVAIVRSSRTRLGVSEITFARRASAIPGDNDDRRRVAAELCPTFVEATKDGQAAYNAFRQRNEPPVDPCELAYQRLLAVAE
jgi:RimJ/RimL family protein N-acetyltransferase